MFPKSKIEESLASWLNSLSLAPIPLCFCYQVPHQYIFRLPSCMVMITISTQSIGFIHIFIHLLSTQTSYLFCMDGTKLLDVVTQSCCSFWKPIMISIHWYVHVIMFFKSIFCSPFFTLIFPSPHLNHPMTRHELHEL